MSETPRVLFESSRKGERERLIRGGQGRLRKAKEAKDYGGRATVIVMDGWVKDSGRQKMRAAKCRAEPFCLVVVEEQQITKSVEIITRVKNDMQVIIQITVTLVL